MEYTQNQLSLLPPETSIERTLRTGKIDVFGLAVNPAMAELVAIFDDVVEHPEHYYKRLDGRSKNLMSPASTLGQFMVRKAMRLLGEATIDKIQENRADLYPSFMKHLNYATELRGAPDNAAGAIMFDVQKGVEQQRAAYNVLIDAPKTPGSGYAFNVLRSDNGLGAKVLCTIVDAPNQVLMSQELDTHFSNVEKIRPLLRAFIDLRVIEIDHFRSVNEYEHGVPTNIAYAAYPDHHPHCQTHEDSELMALARYHTKRYDESEATV